jgi:predicted PurR-regulated permease PerM
VHGQDGAVTLPEAQRTYPASVRGQMDLVLPPAGRSRRVAEWGVVAWAVVGVAVVIWLLVRLFHGLGALLPYLVMAGMVVLVLSPAVRALTRLRVPRELAVTIVFAVASVATPAVVPLILRTLLNQVRSLLRSSPTALESGGLVGRLAGSSNSMLHALGKAIKANVQSYQTHAAGHLASVGSILAHAAVVVLLGGFLGYLILLSRPGIGAGLMLMVPPSRRAIVQEVTTEMGRIVGSYVRARLIVSAAVGVLATIGLWAIGMPFWLVLGLAVGLANLIPTLGAYIGGAPVVLVALLTKPPAFLFAALAVIVLSHVVDGFILSPIILSETMHLHPVVVLLSVVVGAELAGIWGVLAAIPVSAMIQFLLRRWVSPKVYGDPRDPVAVSAADLPPGEAASSV